jgi:hypothetical protein
MTIKGCDYAFSHPNPLGLYALGYRFALRYVGPGSAPKLLTSAEAAQIHAAGLPIGFLVEGAAGDIFEGAAKGSLFAIMALHAVENLGVPHDRVKYWFAADKDVTPNNIELAIDFFRGVNQTMFPDEIGVYGDTDIINELHRLGLATGFYLTAAASWSPHPPTVTLDITQTHNGVNAAGGVIDIDTAPQLPPGMWYPNQKPVITESESDMRVIHVPSGAVYLMLSNVDPTTGLPILIPQTDNHYPTAWVQAGIPYVECPVEINWTYFHQGTIPLPVAGDSVANHHHVGGATGGVIVD